MLRAIWSTADFEVLYDTHWWPCNTSIGPGPSNTDNAAYLVGDGAAHAANEDDAPAVTEAAHLPARGLSGVQHAIDVDTHDLLG